MLIKELDKSFIKIKEITKN